MSNDKPEVAVLVAVSNAKLGPASCDSKYHNSYRQAYAGHPYDPIAWWLA